MFRRLDFNLISNPICSKAVDDLEDQDMLYYDKDGFELNLAERKFYQAMGFPLHNCLNHICYQEPWFEISQPNTGLIIDHSLILHRCSYSGDAQQQLESLKVKIPQADLILRTRQKWGFDFALDSVTNGEVFEVLHIEYDSYDYEYFKTRLICVEYTIRHTDWIDAASRIWQQKSQWQHLRGFEQNHWKANYLLGWSTAETTEKSI